MPTHMLSALLFPACALAALAHSAAELADRERSLRDICSRTFIDPRTGVLYTRTSGDNLEDTSLYGGLYLAALKWSMDHPLTVLSAYLLAIGLGVASAEHPGYTASPET